MTARLDRCALLDRDALHLTLCFLGSRPVAEIAAIGQAVNACPAELGELSVGAPLWLPSSAPARAGGRDPRRRGRAVAGCTAALIRAISEATGWEPERRRFRAHITVARTRGREPRGADPLVGLVAGVPTPPLRFSAESLTLYRSWLAPGGASYEALTFARAADRWCVSDVIASADGFRRPRRRRASAEPSLESVGSLPSSHVGSDSSSQENMPSPAGAGWLPSSQVASIAGAPFPGASQSRVEPLLDVPGRCRLRSRFRSVVAGEAVRSRPRGSAAVFADRRHWLGGGRRFCRWRRARFTEARLVAFRCVAATRLGWWPLVVDARGPGLFVSGLGHARGRMQAWSAVRRMSGRGARSACVPGRSPARGARAAPQRGATRGRGSMAAEASAGEGF